MMKKICLAMALLFGLALAAPAQAVWGDAAQTVLTSEMSLPEVMLAAVPVIDVTVPRTGRIVINPYGLETEIGGTVSTEQIAGETLTIHNASEVPVVVSASVAGRIYDGSGMTFVSAPPALDAQEKDIFLYAEFQRADGVWSGGYTNAENQILISGSASEAKDVLMLDAGPSEGVFRVRGAATVSPAEPWSTDDGVSVVITFTFSEYVDPAADMALIDNLPVPEYNGAQESGGMWDFGAVPELTQPPENSDEVQNWNDF